MSEAAVRYRGFRFDEIAVLVKDRIDNPTDAKVDRYIGLEHLDSNSLKIRRWGKPSDVESTKLIFRSGDIIFGKRRVYQRKLAVAEFDGICSAHAMVLRAKSDVVLPEFLPFFMQSDIFMERALEISVGSLSPTINWKALAKEKFSLPPLEEQRRIIGMMSIVDSLVVSYTSIEILQKQLIKALAKQAFDSTDPSKTESLKNLVTKLGSGITPRGGATVYEKSGVIFLRSQNVYPEGLRLDGVAFIPKAIDNEMSNTRVYAGDVLLNISGASMGRCTIYNRTDAANVNQHVCILRPDSKYLDSKYLTLFLQSDYGQSLISKFSTKGNREGLNFQQIGGFPIPISHMDAQVVIGNAFINLLQGLDIVRNRIRATLDLRRGLLNRSIGVVT
jgi:type I restriction enzyme, S subunit